MSQSIVFSLQSDADAYSASIDAKMGYPKPGVDIGGGYHQPGGGVTLHHARVDKHPTLAAWAYPYDAAIQAQAVPLPQGDTAQPLDATWTPAPPATFAGSGGAVATADQGAATP